MIKGIIFDMDGVISDTQKLHAKVESELLARYGIKLSPEEISKKYSGVRTRDFFDELLKTQAQPYNLDELMKEKWQEMRKFAAESIDPIPGAIELIKTLAKKYPLALASASNIDYVKTVLETLDISSYFSALVSGDMVSKGKPDPESFLLTASKINIPPENCLVIEDGISGMQAAKNGHMYCIGLVQNKDEDCPTKNLVLSLSEINSDYLDNIKL